MAVLPHYSPGYSGMGHRRAAPAAGTVRSVPARPARGARFGRAAAQEIATGGVRTHAPRRPRPAPHRLGALRELLVRPVPVPPRAVPAFAVRPRRTAVIPRGTASYSVNPKALRRWAAERLTLERAPTAPSTRASATTAPPAPTWAARWHSTTRQTRAAARTAIPSANSAARPCPAIPATPRCASTWPTPRR